MAIEEQNFEDRTPLTPWTEIPFVPLPPRDPTQGGQFLNSAREMNIGDGGANVFRIDKQGMWLGAKEYTDAPFKVSMLGAIIASAITIIGGTITGATIQTSALSTTGIKLDGTSLRGYNSSGDETLTISTITGYILLKGYVASSLVRTLYLGAGTGAAAHIEDSSTAEPGFQWRGPSSGTNTASREDIPAFYHLNQNCQHGDGFTSKNNYSGWDGKHFHVIPDSSKVVSAFYIKESTWGAVIGKSEITTEGYIDFPAFHHSSEFDENPAVLASTVIAKAYWEGGGASGTQEIKNDDVSDGLYRDTSYMRLSTTATASRSSTLKFYQVVTLANQARWDAVLGTDPNITTVERRFGWYRDASNYAYFYFDTDQHATKLYFAYNTGSGETLVDLGYNMVAHKNLHRFTIQCYNDSMYIYVDDVLKATIASSPPQYGHSYFYVDNKASAVERALNIDYAKHWQGRSATY